MTVTFKLKIATPMVAGGADPYEPDEKWHIRPTAIKGIWRWWARALVAGVLYDRGCLWGESDGIAVLRPTSEEARVVAEAVGKSLGLGYVLGNESARSQYSLRLKLQDRQKFKPYVYQKSSRDKGSKDRHAKTSNDSFSDLQRLDLLVRSKKGEGVKYDLDHEFELTVEGPPGPALKILVVALTLGGVGKGSRKGLGSLDITEVYGMAKNPIKQVLEETYSEVDQLLGRSCGRPPDHLPPLPALSKITSEVYFIRDVRFEQLHNFFLKSYRAKVLSGSPKAKEELRKRLEAWVLGLPRMQKDPKKNICTGYFIKVDVDRRASTFMISYHSASHVFGHSGMQGGYLTIIRSADWPKKLSWASYKVCDEENKRTNIGAGRAHSTKQDRDRDREITIELDIDEIKRAYETAKAEFFEYVKRLGGSYERAWP